MDQSFQGFAAAVEATVDKFAKSKGYTTEDGETGNVACEALKLMGINFPHKIGEIVYKCVEFMHSPRRVILEKIAGTAYIAWRDCEVTPAADIPPPSPSSSER